jgi:hypothetical protein
MDVGKRLILFSIKVDLLVYPAIPSMDFIGALPS